MPVEAKVSTTWKRRFYLLIAFMAAFALWFIYDGAIKYPRLNSAYAAHQQLVHENRADDWLRISELNGWPAKPPQEPLEASSQYLYGGIAAAIAAGLGIWVLISLRRSIRSDDESIYSVTGHRVPFADVHRIDMKKWDSKGIAFLHYETSGKTGRLRVDDYKYEGAAAILDQIKAYQQARK